MGEECMLIPDSAGSARNKKKGWIIHPPVVAVRVCGDGRGGFGEEEEEGEGEEEGEERGKE